MNKPNTETVKAALAKAKQRLVGVSDSSGLDVQVLLAHILCQKRAWLLAHPEEPLNQKQHKEFKDGLTCLEKGEPLPYLLGEWEFYGLSFSVTPDVLIPRPETEILVETAINWLKTEDKKLAIVDVGTGSGIIPICIASHHSDVFISAIDISGGALKIAKKNASRHGVSDRIDFLQNNLLSDMETKFDLITANLPYIPTETLKDLAVHKFEPRLALDGGDDGLVLIQRLLEHAPQRLNPGGLILLEIEYRQGEVVKEMAFVAFPNAQITVQPDLAGHDRFVLIQT